MINSIIFGQGYYGCCCVSTLCRLNDEYVIFMLLLSDIMIINCSKWNWFIIINGNLEINDLLLMVTIGVNFRWFERMNVVFYSREELQDHVLIECNGKNNICYCRYHQYGCRKTGISNVMSLYEYGCIYSLVHYIYDDYCEWVLLFNVRRWCVYNSVILFNFVVSFCFYRLSYFNGMFFLSLLFLLIFGKWLVILCNHLFSLRHFGIGLPFGRLRR